MMNIEEIKAYFLSKPGAVDERPFGPNVPVFKVGNKMFGLIHSHDGRLSMNVKYPQEDMAAIRSLFEEIVPGYHMNKNHWNTVYLDGELDPRFITELVDISYNLIFKKLTKQQQHDLLINSI